MVENQLSGKTTDLCWIPAVAGITGQKLCKCYRKSPTLHMDVFKSLNEGVLDITHSASILTSCLH